MNPHALFMSHFPHFHGWVRKRAPYILLGGSVISVAAAPKEATVAVTAFWLLLAIAMVLWAYSWSRHAANLFDGRIVEFIFTPTPMGSLCAALARQNVPVEDIQFITLMSSDLAQTKKYLASSRNGEESFLEILNRCKDIQVRYYGYSIDPNIQSNHPRIEFVRMSEKRTEHFNLVKTKRNAAYAWYEPCHDIVNGDDCFGGGGYLVELTPHGVVDMERFFEKLPLSKVDLEQMGTHVYA